VSLFEHVPHSHIEARKAEGPIKVADQHATGNAVTKFNTRAALWVTKVVGSMWCAYAFALFDLISLPGSLRAGTMAIVSWVAQTFLQLVLLSVIMVGQDVQAKASDARAEQTYQDAEAVLHTALAIEEHLQAQDALLKQIVSPVSN
jgi:hypothetical protein